MNEVADLIMSFPAETTGASLPVAPPSGLTVEECNWELRLNVNLGLTGTGERTASKEQATKICTPYWKCPIFDDDDDDDEESSIPLKDIIFELPLSIAITPDFPITDSLIMEDEYLNTIPETESDEENESSVEDLNLTPSESEDLFDIESECDMPVCDDFMTFSNPLFDSNDDFTSSDDESLSDEDNLCIKTRSSILSSPKFDSLLEEFSGKLAHIDLISPKINEADFDPEEEIRLVEKLLISPDCEDSRARGFVLRSLELQSLA
ncbi:hypothetical protein Tco_0121109 [Tanacetum coccineum]